MGIAVSIIICFFAVYGILQMITKWMLHSHTAKGEKPIFLHRALGVYNCENSIEGLIRTLEWEDTREQLIVIDLGSTDDTLEILNRLAEDLSFIRVMTQEEYFAYLSVHTP